MHRPHLGFRNAGLTVAVLLGLASVAAAGSWLNLAPAGDDAAPLPPSLAVTDQDLAGFDVDIYVPGVSISARTTKGGVFFNASWPDAAFAGELGTPARPVIRRLFVAPPRATVSVTATTTQPTVIDVAAAGYDCPLIPVQASIEKLPGARERAPFNFDPAAYNVDADTSAPLATVTEIGIVRGQRLFLLEVAPVAYNPVRGTLSIPEYVSVQVRFDGADAWPTEYGPPRGLRNNVLNPAALPPAPRGSGKYLIIADEDYAAGISSFASAKAAQGFTVSTWVPSTSSATAIKQYIQNLWDAGDGPDYVLLVGDTDTIPNWTGGGAGSPATDLPYSCMDGSSDWYPDIALGRFPVRSPEHLQAIVNKTLYYENGLLADPDYLMRAVFMASDDNYTVSEGTHNWVIEHYMDPAEIVCDKLYCHTYSATTQQVRDAFNDGRFYGIYSGHGGTYSWADGPPFSQDDVEGLTNENMYAFVCSFACITGTYTVDECFVETWIRQPNKGAVAIYGSSVNSYWTEDDILEKRLFDSIYDEDDEVPAEVGPVWNDARSRYIAEMGSDATTRRYFEMYNLMGDPSMRFPNAGDPLYVTLPELPPVYFTPGEQTTITVRIESGTENYVPDSGLLHYRYDDGEFLTAVLTPLGDNLFSAILPAAGCDDTPEFYFSATGDAGTTIFNPPTAPEQTYTADVAFAVTIFSDNFETDLGWSVVDTSLESGSWDRGTPVGPGLDGVPPGDYDGSGQCYLTGNSLGEDIDGGPTRLVSPAIDVTAANDPVLRYARWWSNDDCDLDYLCVEISANDGASWTVVERVFSHVDEQPAWVERAVRLADYIPLTDTFRVRFRASDIPNNSTDEAAIDAVRIVDVWCIEFGSGDVNCDGATNYGDIDPFVQALTCPGGVGWNRPCPWLNADCNGDGDVTYADIDAFVARLSGSGL